MSGVKKAWDSIGIGAGSVGSWWMKRATGPCNILEVNLGGQVVEDVHLTGLWQRLLPPPILSMRELLHGIGLAAEDGNIKALYLRISDHDLGWGRAEELCEAIRRFRAAGKYAVAFLEEPENVDTLIAASCDQVLMPPGVPLYLTGLLSEVMYLKGVLDKLEIEPELFQAGKYKSAVEPYTRTGMSKEHREAVEAVLDSIYNIWVEALVTGRGLSRERVAELIDQGPWLAEEAREQGLVDALLYEDEVDDYIERWLGIAPCRIPLDRFLKVFGPRPGVGDPWKKTEALALITATGPIHGGESRYYGPGDTTVGADTLRHALETVRKEDRIAAVVLRIDSPGGSASHSDLIWREVDRLTRVKPVVVSMADMAASGGYYIAMPANHIMASPATLTGSIGVIGGKLNLKGLYSKIGIKKEQVRRGKNADLMTDYGPYSPELKKKLKREMESVYKIFVEKAASGRKQSYDDLEKSAQGRVWTGEQAKSLGLVDELGNLISALERAKERAGIPIFKKVPLFTLPRIRKISLPFNLPLPLPGRSARILSRLSLFETLADSRLLTMLPFHLRINERPASRARRRGPLSRGGPPWYSGNGQGEGWFRFVPCDLQSLQREGLMSELRRDPVDGRWVIIASERRKRPVDFHTVEYKEESAKSCPFCPGNEAQTPPEIYAIRDPKGEPNGPDWELRVIPNKFPALRVEGDLHREGVGYFDKISGTGAHEVIIETPDHNAIRSTVSINTLEILYRAYRERIVDLRNDRRLKYVMLFKNYGEAAGASLAHPHAQLIALPIMPKQIVEEMNGAREYYNYKQRCIFCDIVHQEESMEERLVCENEGFVAICPWASIFPFEIWILPRSHDSCFEDCDPTDLARLAAITSEVHKRLDAALRRPHYNSVLHTSPFDEQYNNYYHWHLEIMPRLTRVAGFEYGTGFYINPVPPEEAAHFLREVEIN